MNAPSAPDHPATGTVDLAEADPQAFRDRAEVVALLRRSVDAARAEGRAILDQKGGLACARLLSSRMDDAIRWLFDWARQVAYPAANPSTGERMAIAAVGGYGRAALAPGSDIDLLFVLPAKSTAWCESIVEAILYVLWDLKLKVGHATRSVEDCLREAKADLTIRTSLLEARLIAGDAALFADMENRFDREIVRGSAAHYVAAKLAERDARLSRTGESRYRVEPNVKEGKGGLRDLNTLYWIAKYVYRVRDTRELVGVGLYSEEERRLFERCEDFLWRVRCHMHFATGRAEERLTFDLQSEIAPAFGYKSHAGLSAVERFMKRYFLVAKAVGDLTAILCAALEVRHDKPRPMLDRLLGRLRGQTRRRNLDAPGFAIEQGRIVITDPNLFARQPREILRAFWLSDNLATPLHPAAAHLISASLGRIGPDLRHDAEANRMFVEILTSKRAPEAVLRRLNETGVLGRFIPEFGRVVAMMQFNRYHHFTVDEHLIRTVGVLADLEAGRLSKAELPLSHSVLPTIANRRALFVAAFLHDVAKRRPEDHAIGGARIARRLCPRFGLDAAETDTVAWLIEHHLLMSGTAQSRDLADPRTIEAFAAVVQTLERLKLLLILTVCDIQAVGPGVWNNWKGELLRTLYYETEVVLTGGHSAIERRERVHDSQRRLRALLTDWDDASFEAYVARHYPPYWLRVDGTRQLGHARFLAASESKGESLATRIDTDAFRGVTELTVLAPDHPRLLSIIAGACALSGANIVDAHIYTTTDGFALDTIFVSRAFERDEDELRRASRIAETIEKALRGEIHTGRALAARKPAKRGDRTFDVTPQVIIDNTLSNRQTVIEMSGLDRPGLLHDLTTSLSKLSLNIGSAHISTIGERAVDVFYVTDLTGGKIVNAGRQAQIRRQLIAALTATPTGDQRTQPDEQGSA